MQSKILLFANLLANKYNKSMQFFSELLNKIQTFGKPLTFTSTGTTAATKLQLISKILVFIPRRRIYTRKTEFVSNSFPSITHAYQAVNCAEVTLSTKFCIDLLSSRTIIELFEHAHAYTKKYKQNSSCAFKSW